LSGQFRVQPDVIIIAPPSHEHEAGVRQRLGQGLVEAFIALATIEALDEVVLHRLPGRDIMPFDLTLPRPRIDVISSKRFTIMRQAKLDLAALATGRKRGWSDSHFLGLVLPD
jgi:hypothetical protein